MENKMAVTIISREKAEKIKREYELVKFEDKGMSLYYPDGKEIDEKEWIVVVTSGKDTKYGRWAYSDIHKQYRYQVTANEFYGNSNWD